VDLDPASSGYGHVPCVFYAVFQAGTPACACDGKGYAPTSPPDAVVEYLRDLHGCADPCCTDLCVCEFLQLEGPELLACQNGTEHELSPAPIGWCYVSPDQGIGNPELVSSCPDSERRLIRIVPFRHDVIGIFICQSALLSPEQDG
jgi:hypothetical protein